MGQLSPSTSVNVAFRIWYAIPPTAGGEFCRFLGETVIRACANGWSWNRIPAALGVSRQAARQRFGGKVGV
jgi:hypothetical protein